MYKIEYNLEINETGDYIIKLADDYKDIIEHKILYLVMSRFLLENMVKYYKSNNIPVTDEEDQNVDITLKTISVLVEEIEQFLKINSVELEDNKHSDFVSHTVSTKSELMEFKKGDIFAENSFVKNNTIFYCTEEKNMYIYKKNGWVVFKNDN